MRTTTTTQIPERHPPRAQKLETCRGDVAAPIPEPISCRTHDVVGDVRGWDCGKEEGGREPSRKERRSGLESPLRVRHDVGGVALEKLRTADVEDVHFLSLSYFILTSSATSEPKFDNSQMSARVLPRFSGRVQQARALLAPASCT